MATVKSAFMAEDKNLFVSGYKPQSIWGSYAGDESPWARMTPSAVGANQAPAAPGLASAPSEGSSGSGIGSAGAGAPGTAGPGLFSLHPSGYLASHNHLGHAGPAGHVPHSAGHAGHAQQVPRTLSGPRLQSSSSRAASAGAAPVAPAPGLHSASSYNSLHALGVPIGTPAVRSSSGSSGVSAASLAPGSAGGASPGAAHTALAVAGSAGPSGQGQALASPNVGHTNRSHARSPSSDDELIPTAIVVKNIPFAIKKEQLVEVMTQLGLPLPYAFNYHFDNGVFRGLAFANFSTPDETATVITHLNGREIGGRKLRVEYKKMLPLQERERIEREKRERRGQLEEQHQTLGGAGGSTVGDTSSSRGGSPTSSHASSPVAAHGTLGVGADAVPPATPSSISSATPSSGYASAHSANSAVFGNAGAFPYYAPPASLGPALAGTSALVGSVDLNDQENLDLYTSLILFRSDREVAELAMPVTLAPATLSTLQILSANLGLGFAMRDGRAVISRSRAPQQVHYPSAVFRSAVPSPAH